MVDLKRGFLVSQNRFKLKDLVSLPLQFFGNLEIDLSAIISQFLIQHILTMSKYGHSELNIRRCVLNADDILLYRPIYVILCVAEKNDRFFQLSFPINVENCALSSVC